MLNREAHPVAALPSSIPHAPLIGFGSRENVTWTLHERVVGEALDAIWLDLPLRCPRQVTTSRPDIVHGDAVFANVLVHEGRTTAVLDFEWARKGPRDLELFSLIRVLADARALHGPAIPPVMRWMREDYPQLFKAPDLDRRLWLYTLAYTVRGIVYWPPDRPETELFDVHQLHRLRRLTKAGLDWR